MSFSTVAGSTLAVSATAPGSYDAAGYGASAMVYTNIGEITDLGGDYGRTYNTVTHAPIGSAQVTEKKGGFRLGTRDITLAWDETDAGQVICRTAERTNDILTFRLTKQDGSRRFFTAQISRFVENFGTVDNVVVGMLQLLPQRDVVRVA